VPVMMMSGDAGDLRALDMADLVVKVKGSAICWAMTFPALL
jgi:hypothetical protein